MRRIDIAHLDSVLSDRYNKEIQCSLCSKTMMQQVYTSQNLFELIEGRFNKYELASWIKSNEYYINKKDISGSGRYNAKDIVYVNLGSNLSGELSYEHPCIVIINEFDKVFVVPCSSGKLNRIRDKSGDLFPEYMIGEKTDGFTKQTALILNNARWISKSRIIRKYKNPVTSQFFNNLYNKLFSYLFESKQYQVDKQREVIDKLNIEMIRLNDENTRLENENLQLLKQIDQFLENENMNEKNS